jgi:protein O-GlcNAc transferase
LLQEHVGWAQRFAPSRPAGAVSPRPAAGRKIRIGYVSPDLKRHSVAYFLEPILEAHDRSRFELFAYSNTESPDEVTERLKRYCDGWRVVA